MNIEVLADGYQLVEAPRADGHGAVWFTDVLGGGIHRWSDGRVDTVVPKRRGVGGLALHADQAVGSEFHAGQLPTLARSETDLADPADEYRDRPGLADQRPQQIADRLAGQEPPPPVPLRRACPGAGNRKRWPARAGNALQRADGPGRDLP